MHNTYAFVYVCIHIHACVGVYVHTNTIATFAGVLIGFLDGRARPSGENRGDDVNRPRKTAHFDNPF